MNQRLVALIREVTGVGFTAGLVLIGFGVLGLSASPPLAGGVLVLGLAGPAVREPLRAQVDHAVAASYLASVPLAPLIAGGVMLVFLGASPGELQTLGGVIGLLAVLNHMLRPLYAFAHYLLARVSGVLA